MHVLFQTLFIAKLYGAALWYSSVGYEILLILKLLFLDVYVLFQNQKSLKYLLNQFQTCACGGACDLGLFVHHCVRHLTLH